jgi:hypothetical protein
LALAVHRFGASLGSNDKSLFRLFRLSEAELRVSLLLAVFVQLRHFHLEPDVIPRLVASLIIPVCHLVCWPNVTPTSCSTDNPDLEKDVMPRLYPRTKYRDCAADMEMSESLVFDLMNTLSELPEPGDVAETLISCRTCFREQVPSTPALPSGNTLVEFDALLQVRVDHAGEKDVFRVEPAPVREPEVVDDPVDFLLTRLDEVVMWLVDFLEKLSQELGDEILLGFVQELLIDLVADLLVAELAVASDRGPFGQTEH